MRRFSVQHLVKDDAHWPDITFGRVSISIQNFGAHVHGTTDKGLVDLFEFRTLLIILGETEVSNLVNFILNQNVGRFEVSMNHWVFVQVFVAIDELFHDYEGFIFGHFFPFLQYVFKWPSVTEFLEKVNVVCRFLYVKKFHNVVIFDGFHYFNLVFQRVVKFLWILFYVRGWDCFHCNQLSRSDVGALEDFAVWTSSDLIVNVDDEWLYKFVVRSTKFGSFFLDLLHFVFVHLKYLKRQWLVTILLYNLFYNTNKSINFVLI